MGFGYNRVAHWSRVIPGAVWLRHIEQLRDAESTLKTPKTVVLFPSVGSPPSH